VNVTLNSADEDFVRRKVEAGDFESADEVVGAGLRLLQEQEILWADEARRKIEEGWAQAQSGQLHSVEQVRELLTARKKEWRRLRTAG
jgi:antitoxin ParD1/3/4